MYLPSDRTSAGRVDRTTEPMGAYNLHIYQPAGRFWTFQLIEAGVFIALAAVLLALTIHRVRRRLS
jgi:hypothetical protein